MTHRFDLYLGKAGHLAMMAEFLMRGWNVAIPEVDVGDDIFVVQDENGTLRRVQVKTATASKSKNCFSAKYQIPKQQLLKLAEPKVHYAFIARHNDTWTKPLILRQDLLKDNIEAKHVGTVYKNQITVYFSHKKDQVICSNLDFTKHVGDYSDFPNITH